jgi:hypothetical protein
MNSTSIAARVRALLLLAIAPGAVFADGSRIRETTCTNLSACTVPIQFSSTTWAYPRQLSCVWTPNDATRALRRVVISHQPLGMPPRLTFALPVDAETQNSFALKAELQSVNLLPVKGGNLNLVFEWSTPVTVTVPCNLAYTN